MRPDDAGLIAWERMTQAAPFVGITAAPLVSFLKWIGAWDDSKAVPDQPFLMSMWASMAPSVVGGAE